eukprot:8946565-Alexandrium_andersonii.AAC.1
MFGQSVQPPRGALTLQAWKGTGLTLRAMSVVTPCLGEVTSVTACQCGYVCQHCHADRSTPSGRVDVA